MKSRFAVQKLSVKHSVTTGYTLLELLFAMTLFSMLLALIFTVFSSLRKTERFRDENVRLTRAASFAFEPMVRSIKHADAVEELDLPGIGCKSVRGFYGNTTGPLFSTDSNGNVAVVTVAQDKIFDEQTNGTVYRWVKRSYQVENGKLTEKTWRIADTTNFAWPKPLSCHRDTIWQEDDRNPTRNLIGDGVKVKEFLVRMEAPVLSAEGTFEKSPFITLVLTVVPDKTNVIAPPVTFTSTIVPTFVYGEQRND